MKVKVSFTVDIDYEAWSELRKRVPGMEVSPAAARRNIQALAEEGFDNSMVDYIDYDFVN